MNWLVPNLWLIPALPLLAAGVTALAKRSQRRLAATLAIGSMGVSFLLSCWAFVQTLGEHAGTGAERHVHNFNWLRFGDIWLQLGWVLDPLTAVMLVMVTFVGLLIFIYSVGYMAHDDNFTRFFCFMSLFAAAMLGVVIANSLLFLFVCWELVGLSSYLLIGFWYHKPSAAAAANKAFIVTRIGDIGFFLGILWLYAKTGTLLFYDNGNGCLEQSSLTALTGQATFWGMGASTVISLLIFCGAIGKSGQVPLHVWLPDAMEGPTPVSALIHAATMVAAGVFLVARMYPLMSSTNLEMRPTAFYAPGNVGRATQTRPTPDPSQEGSRHSSAPGQFRSWEGLGVGSREHSASWDGGTLTPALSFSESRSFTTSRAYAYRGRFACIGRPLLWCPEGTSENSPAFQRWVGRQKVASPEGTVEVQSHPSFNRPFGTCVPCAMFPGVKTPGYSQDVPPACAEPSAGRPEQRNGASAFCAKQVEPAVLYPANVASNVHGLLGLRAGQSRFFAESVFGKWFAGSTGDQPVPSGDSPDRTGATARANGHGLFATLPAAVPVGGSPTGAGGSPSPLIYKSGSEPPAPGESDRVLHSHSPAPISNALKAVTWIGAITALFAALIAVAQTDIKRILAYSTVSQLGYMMMGLGVGGVAVGMFHLITHAFFKALLFLGAGSVIHGCHEEQDIRRMGGLRKHMPVTFATYAIGMMALSGFPLLFSGFWSKDEILHAAWLWQPSKVPFILGISGAFLTAFYMTRQLCYVFFGERGTGGSPASGHGQAGRVPDATPHESPRVMTVPLIILAAFSILLGFIGMPWWPWFQSYLGAGHEAAVGGGVLILMLISTLVVFAGLGVGGFIYGLLQPDTAEEKDVLESWFPSVFGVLRDKFYVDELYERTVVRANAAFCRFCHWLDSVVLDTLVLVVSYVVIGLSWLNRVIDEYVVNLGFDAACQRLRNGGGFLSRLQDGQVQNYLRVLALALTVLLLLLTWGCGK